MTKAFGKDIFLATGRSNWIPVLQKYFLNYLYLKGMYKILKEIGIICIKVDKFRKSVNF